MDEDLNSAKKTYGRFTSQAAGASESLTLEPNEISDPNPGVDQAVKAIYIQAHRHRDRLISFYVWYASLFTIAVVLVLFVQSGVRIVGQDKKFEIMPEWTLDILVTGMFVQFVGLLKVVTESAWNFKAFFDHHNEMKHSKDP
jgi:hypothetical protein